jgi:hypothetical protein
VLKHARRYLPPAGLLSAVDRCSDCAGLVHLLQAIPQPCSDATGPLGSES